jgi:hypothetical protein
MHNLTSVVIPNNIESIGNCAFNDCPFLTSVTIGNSVMSIGDYAFQYCTGLTKIISLNLIPPTIYVDTFLAVNKSIPLYVPDVEAY